MGCFEKREDSVSNSCGLWEETAFSLVYLLYLGNHRVRNLLVPPLMINWEPEQGASVEERRAECPKKYQNTNWVNDASNDYRERKNGQAG